MVQQCVVGEADLSPTKKRQITPKSQPNLLKTGLLNPKKIQVAESWTDEAVPGVFKGGRFGED